MSESDKKVLVSVEIVDNFIKAKGNVDFWRKALTDAQKNTKDYTQKDLNELSVQLAKANNEYREAKKAIESASKTEELFNATSEKTNQTLGEMQRELSALRNTPLTGVSDEDAKKIKQRMADLTASIQDYKTEIKGMDTGQVWKNMADGIQFVSASAQSLGQGLNVLGVESETFDKLQKSTLELIGLTQALGVVSVYLEKKKLKLLAANLSNIAAMIKENVVTAASAIAYKVLGKSVDASSKSFKLLRTAIIATGLGALVVLVGALIANWDTLVGWFKKGTEGISGFGKALDKTKEIIVGVWEVFKNYLLAPFKAIGKLVQGDLKGAFNELKNGVDVVANYQKGAMEQMARNAENTAQKQTEAQRKANAKRLNSEADALEKELEISRARGENADKLYEKERAILDKRTEATRLSLANMEDSNSDAYKEMEKTLEDFQQKQAVLDAQNQKRLADEDSKKQEAYIRRLDAEQAYEEARLKAQRKYLNDSSKTDAENNALRLQAEIKTETELFTLQQSYAQKRLDAQLKFGKITSEEYANQIALLTVNATAFQNEQTDKVNSYYESRKKEIIGMMKKDAEAEIKAISSNYDQAIKDVMSDKKMSEEEQVFYATELERQKQNQIKAIRKGALAEQIKEIEEATSETYAQDLARFSDNEREKLKVQIQQQNDIIAAKKAKGLDTYEDEANLRSLELTLSKKTLDADLLNTQLSLKQRYELKRDSLLKEQELYKDNADKQAEIVAQLAEIDSQYQLERIEGFEEWAWRSMEMLMTFDSMLRAIEENKISRAEEDNERQKESLDQRLKSGLISQKQYDDEVAKLDKDLDKKKAEIARKQAIREKAMAIFQVGINTAMAIMGLWVKPGFPMAIPMTIAVSALGLAQLATVLATPLPKARRGAYISGNSHENGGVLIEAEGGEAIINKRAVAAFPELVGLMNAMGNSGRVPDGGYAFRSLTSPSYRSAGSSAPGGLSADELAGSFREAVKDLRIYTSVKDIREADKQYTYIDGIGKM